MEETDLRILNAALELFRREGFEGATMRDIARLAGVATGAAYYYYPSKDAIVTDFYRRSSREMQPQIEEALAGVSGLEKRLQALIRIKLTLFAPNRGVLRALLRNGADPRHPLSPFSVDTREIREIDTAWFGRILVDCGVRIPRDLAPHLPGILWFLQMGVIFFWVIDESADQKRAERLLELAVKAVVSLIRVSGLPLMRPVRKTALDLVESPGIPVWAHAMVFPATPKQVVDAGVDVVSHICMIAYQASDVLPTAYHGRAPVDAAKFAQGDNKVMAALFQDMRKRGTIIDATDRIYAEMEKAAAKHPGGKPPYCPADLAAKLTAQAERAGVPISAGTDGFTPAEAPFPSLYEEMYFLNERAGLSRMKVIQAATQVGAMTIGHQAEMGTLEPGKLANLVVLANNPLDDLHNLESVVFSEKRGVRYDRQDYHPPEPGAFPDED